METKLHTKNKKNGFMWLISFNLQKPCAPNSDRMHANTFSLAWSEDLVFFTFQEAASVDKQNA